LYAQKCEHEEVLIDRHNDDLRNMQAIAQLEHSAEHDLSVMQALVFLY
jgi:hypothetical protein